MFKLFWTGMLTAAVAAAGIGWADEPNGGTRKSFQVGPLSVEVDVQPHSVYSWDGSSPSGGALVTPVDQSEVKLSDHWIGLGAVPVSPALQSQLNLPEGQGLQVFSVYPDSPAKKAGLHEHDVLLKAGDRALSQVKDLVVAVDEAKGKKLTLDVVRGGKPMKIEVEPAKRPENLGPMEGGPGVAGEGDWKTLHRWLEQMPGHPGMRGPMRFRMFGPGAILPQAAPLPANMSVTITRSGNEPAKITVQQGDKKWEVAENNLAALPADVRPHVERMLQGVRGNSLAEGAPAMPDIEGSPNAAMPGRVEKQLEDMNRQLDRLRRQVEEFQGKNRPSTPAPEKSGGGSPTTKEI
jgi:hypothetical protein